MHIALNPRPHVRPPQTQHPQAHHYVLTKIERIYALQKKQRDKKRLQHLIRYRRQLAEAETSFKRDLARVLSPMIREGLGIKVVLDQQARPVPQFVAQFEFLGKTWQITRKKTFWGCQWSFVSQEHNLLTHCTSANLEARLCYALGKYKHTATHRVGVALLPAASTAGTR